MADFGLAVRSVGDNEVLGDAGTGTPYFFAPEVLDGIYTKELDIWSLGVLLFWMLEGNHPFDGNTKQELFSAIRLGQYEKPFASDECLDLLEKMLEVDASKRITARAAREHEFFKMYQRIAKKELFAR